MVRRGDRELASKPLSRRQYFLNFYVSITLSLIGFFGVTVFGKYVPNSLSGALFWIGYLAYILLGCYLIFRLYVFINKFIRPTGHIMTDTIMQVSLIAGLGVLGLFGIATEILPWAAMYIGPIYALWSAYCYLKIGRSHKA